MKININILLVVLVGCLQLHASQPATAAAAKSNSSQVSDIRDADWDLLTDNVNPVSKTLWSNARLRVVAQLRLAKIEKLKAENQLKNGQVKQLQEELAQAHDWAKMWEDIVVFTQKKRESEEEKYQGELAAAQKTLGCAHAKYEGYKKTTSQQFLALHEQNLKLQEKLEHTNRIRVQQVRDILEISDQSNRKALTDLSKQLLADFKSKLDRVQLDLLDKVSPLIKPAEYEKIEALRAMLS